MDRSRIGRRSRRKGKKFECYIAGMLSRWTKQVWATVRNSGRTDLPGDVYCLSRPCRVIVECKHRKNMTVRDIIKGNAAYRKEVEKALSDGRRSVTGSVTFGGPLVVFVKDEFGIWLYTEPSPLRRIATCSASVKGSDGREWGLVAGLREPQALWC